jgi:hypothetical protein
MVRADRSPDEPRRRIVEHESVKNLAGFGSPAAPTPHQSRLGIRLYYGVGAVAYGVKDNGFSYFLLLYYNQVLGLSAAWVGSAILTALLVDAFSDPIVGYTSDNLHSRLGRRHPFMYMSAVPVALAYFFLWNPPVLGHRALFVYLVVLAILVRTTITLFEIPNSSLVAELTDDYDERTTMLSYRFFFGWWGGLTMAVAARSSPWTWPAAIHPSTCGRNLAGRAGRHQRRPHTQPSILMGSVLSKRRSSSTYAQRSGIGS